MAFRSIKEIFIIGHGPSSSHSMGPFFASNYIVNKYKDQKIKNIDVILFGSLALTGKGHLSDVMIDLGLKDYPHNIVFNKSKKKKHPNTMTFIVTLENNKKISEDVISIGGGSIVTKDEKIVKQENIYPHNNMSEIISYCEENNLSFYDYVIKFENDDIRSYFENVLKSIDESIKNGLNNDGYLPGKLHVKRKAKEMYLEAINKNRENNSSYQVAYTAFAVSEENASGGIVVTGPTCGSSGVIPGCIAYLRNKGVDNDKIIEGLMVAGLFGIVCKMNGSVSGAEAGCQAEIGVASSMGAAMIAYCLTKNMSDIVQSAEIALEHSLGLTCDPVEGYVQIPCIERCAVYALKAIDAFRLATIIANDSLYVSYDDSIKTMLKTGKDMDDKYKETSLGGLAKIIKERLHRRNRDRSK